MDGNLAGASPVERPVRPGIDATPLPELPAPNEPPVFGFTSADMRAYARAYAMKARAAERERCAQYLRDAAERLAPEGKRATKVDRHVAHVLACKGDELAALRDA